MPVFLLSMFLLTMAAAFLGGWLSAICKSRSFLPNEDLVLGNEKVIADKGIARVGAKDRSTEELSSWEQEKVLEEWIYGEKKEM
ncbi:MAG: hypothetical protein RR396_06240, partial [Clostridiales bacterium]